MKFFKPISEQNVTIPTMQSFLESKRVTTLNISSYIYLQVNNNNSLVLKDVNNKYTVIPILNLQTNNLINIYNPDYDEIYNIRVSRSTNTIMLQDNDTGNLINYLEEAFIIDPAKEV